MEIPREGRAVTQSRTAIRLSALAVTLGLLLTVVPLHMLKAGAVPAEIRGVTVAKVLGLQDEKYLSWLESHARDSYYIGTPYISGDHRNPNGDCQDAHGSADSVGVAAMNDLGFVWHVLAQATKASGGKVSEIPYDGGTRWYTFYMANTISRKYFASKDEMLSSGYLTKGDLIFMFDNNAESEQSSRHRVGIYWGDGHSDELWCSTNDYAAAQQGNAIGAIRPVREDNTLYVAVKITTSENALPTTQPLTITPRSAGRRNPKPPRQTENTAGAWITLALLTAATAGVIVLDIRKRKRRSWKH